MGEASLTGQNLVHSRLNQLAVFLHEVRLASHISRTAKSRLQPLLRQLLGGTENHRRILAAKVSPLLALGFLYDALAF
jgi:hypothetical protein